MDLYDVKARGYPSPLNEREIGQLFRTGHFNGRVPCKPKGESSWLTVDDLFPLLKHDAGHLILEEPSPRRKPFLVATLTLLVLGVMLVRNWNRAPDLAAAQPATAMQLPRPANPDHFLQARFPKNGDQVKPPVLPDIQSEKPEETFFVRK